MPKIEKPISEKTLAKLGKTLKGTSYEKMSKETKKKDLENIFDKKKTKKN